LKESKIAKQVKELPTPTQLVAERRVCPLSALQPGANAGKALLVNVIADVSRAALHSHSNSFFAHPTTEQPITPAYVWRCAPALRCAVLLVLFAPCSEEWCGCAVCSSFLVMDGEGKFMVVSIFNVLGDVRKAKLVNV
jgi:hypothetical protein